MGRRPKWSKIRRGSRRTWGEPMPLLEVRGLSVRYDRAQILNGLSLEVGEGEFVGVVGPNGAGKSTLLRAISGLVRFEQQMKRGAGGDIVLEGEVRFAGERIDALPPHEIRRRGLVHCPERRRPFRELTVLENLLAGAFLSSNRSETQRRLDHCFALFPRLSARKAQTACTQTYRRRCAACSAGIALRSCRATTAQDRAA